MKKIWLFLLPVALSAFYEAPWIGEPFQFEWLLRGEVARFKSITTDTGSISYPSAPILGELGLSFCLPDWQAVVAGHAAHTREERSFVLTDGTALVRYAVFDDISGAHGGALTLGLMADFPLKHAIRDPSLLYSAYCEGEFQVSFGKEWAAGRFWDFRAWAFGAVGAGTQGSPWLRGILAVEKNSCDRRRLGLWIEGRQGKGGDSFPALENFRGYGPINYSFADVHLRYSWRICYTSWVYIDYMIRVAADNCPAHRQSLALTCTIPFGI